MTYGPIRRVSASELAARAEAVLNDVEAGCTIEVTRRGPVIAVISPPTSSSESAAALVGREAQASYLAPPPQSEIPPSALAQLIGTDATRAVLAIFLKDPDAAVHQREIARRAHLGLRSAQIALERLVSLGVLKPERDGNRLYYRAERSARFEELKGLLGRELGIAGVIGRHLDASGRKIAWAFIFGSAAAGDDTLASDIDLLIVSEATADELVVPIAAAQRELNREIDLVSYAPADFAAKRAEGNHFIASVLARPRIDVIGVVSMTPDAVEPLPTSPQEIADLFGRFETAMADARVPGQSADGRYVDAYNAGFLLAKIVVRANGYRVKGGDNHLDTLRAVPWVMGSEAQASVDILDAARKRRNAAMYDAAGLVGDRDVEALLVRLEEFESLVRGWLAARHPELGS